MFRIISSIGGSSDADQSASQTPPPFDGPLATTGETFEIRTSDAWRGTVFGYVLSSTAAVEDPPGSCVTVLGAVTVDALSAGLVSDGSSAPTVGVISGGDHVVGDAAACDAQAAVDAGWAAISDANITEGTLYAFYDTVYLPPGADAVIDAIAVGDDDDPVIIAYSPGAFSEVVPAPLGEAGAPAVPSSDLRPVGTEPGDGFDVDAASGVSWQGTIAGMVEIEPAPGFDGRCLAVLGALTGFSDESNSGFSPPPVSIIVEGREQTGAFSDCVADAVQAAGYVDVADLEAPMATTRAPFFQAVALPAAIFGSTAPAAPETVVVGSSLDPDAALFEPAILPAIPAP